VLYDAVRRPGGAALLFPADDSLAGKPIQAMIEE